MPHTCRVELDVWLLYVAAATGLSLVPGPNGLLALTHGVIHGPARTMATIAGGSLGFGVTIAASLFGIGALVVASPELLTTLKWVGGGYLVWLGIGVWRSPAMSAAQGPEARVVTTVSLARAGFLAAVTNPKGLLFFVAFLPQFVVPDNSLLTQFLVLASTVIVIEILVETAIALTASRVQPLLARFGKRVNRVLGLLFMAIGVFLPLR